MLERLQFIVVYVGSAAMAAFLAACLSSVPVATFACDTSGAIGVDGCEFIAARAVTMPTDAMPKVTSATPDAPAPESVTMANSD
jgi:hypothetical protein